MSDKALEEAYGWYVAGPRQRLQPGGAVVIVMTRWNKKDLTGRLTKKMAQDEGADQWKIIGISMQFYLVVNRFGKVFGN